MFPKILGFPPKSSILIGFPIINHPFWGTPIFGNTHIGFYICHVRFPRPQDFWLIRGFRGFRPPSLSQCDSLDTNNDQLVQLKVTCLKRNTLRKLIWTKPPCLWVPALNFPVCTNLPFVVVFVRIDLDLKITTWPTLPEHRTRAPKGKDWKIPTTTFLGVMLVLGSVEVELQEKKLDGETSNIYQFSLRSLGKWSNLTKWVETQPPTRKTSRHFFLL